MATIQFKYTVRGNGVPRSIGVKETRYYGIANGIDSGSCDGQLLVSGEVTRTALNGGYGDKNCTGTGAGKGINRDDTALYGSGRENCTGIG